MAEAINITPERLLLRAIFLTMKPKQRERIYDLLEVTEIDNVIPIRAPKDFRERNAVVGDALKLVGQR